jgi:hypothetical protein
MTGFAVLVALALVSVVAAGDLDVGSRILYYSHASSNASFPQGYSVADLENLLKSLESEEDYNRYGYKRAVFTSSRLANLESDFQVPEWSEEGQR